MGKVNGTVWGEDSQALFRSLNLGTWGSDIPITKCVEMIPKYEEITSQVCNFHLMEESLGAHQLEFRFTEGIV